MNDIPRKPGPASLFPGGPRGPNSGGKNLTVSVNVEQARMLKAAAAAHGSSFSTWALEVLLNELEVLKAVAEIEAEIEAEGEGQ